MMKIKTLLILALMLLTMGCRQTPTIDQAMEQVGREKMKKIAVCFLLPFFLSPLAHKGLIELSGYGPADSIHPGTTVVVYFQSGYPYRGLRINRHIKPVRAVKVRTNGGRTVPLLPRHHITRPIR